MKINTQCICQKALAGKEGVEKIKAVKPELIQGSSMHSECLPAQFANKKLHCRETSHVITMSLRDLFEGYLSIKFINVLS